MEKMTPEQQKLVTDNHNLIYSFLHSKNLSIEEWYDAAAIGLCKAAIGFKEEKSCFSTYAYLCMNCTIGIIKRTERASKTIPEACLVYYDSNFQSGEETQIATILDVIPGGENTEDQAISNFTFEQIEEDMKENEKQIMELFSAGYKQMEIAAIMNCSQPQVSRIKAKIIKKMRKCS